MFLTLVVAILGLPMLDFTLISTDSLPYHTYYMDTSKCPFVHYQQSGMEATRTHIFQRLNTILK